MIGSRLLKKIILALKTREIVPIVKPVYDCKTLDNKVALVTGASGGIGEAIVDELLSRGCKVIAASTKLEKAQNFVMSKHSSDLCPMALDLAFPDTFESRIEEALNFFGKIDFYINAAGVHTENVDYFTIDPSEFDRVIDIDLKGPFFLCREIAKKMKESGKGKIILISSSRGSEPAFSPYGIAKWGMDGMTLGLAKMLSPFNITVNTIAPGSTATNLIGWKSGETIYSNENNSKRMIMPQEVASYVGFLLGDNADMLTGEIIRLSGGRGTYDIK